MGKIEEWDGRERREYGPIAELSEEQELSIAGKAADRVLEMFYKEVGKIAVRIFLLLCGALTVGGLAWLGIQGKIKAPL